MFNCNFFFFFGYGELGNQMFQYVFFRSYLPKNSIIITCNINEIKKFIDLDKNFKFIEIKNKFLKLFCQKFLNKFFMILSKYRIINSIDTELMQYKKFKYEGKKVFNKKGLVPITFIYPRYFQNEFFFRDEVIRNLKFKKGSILSAKKFMKNLPNNVEPVFIHVRSGRRNNEYKKFKIFGKIGVDLPDEYFHECIKWFEKNLNDPFYIIISDNIEFTKDKFSYLKNKIYSKNDIFTDLHIISECKYGIMSNSSVSWWGSYFSQNKNKIFAPKYWYGWKSKNTHQGYAIPRYAETIDPNIFLEKNITSK